MKTKKGLTPLKVLLKTGSGWGVGYWGIGKEPYRLSPSLFPPFFTRSLFHCSPAFFARLHWTKAFYRLVWPGLGLKIVFLCALVYTTNKAVSFCLIISSVHGPRASSRRGRGCGNRLSSDQSGNRRFKNSSGTLTIRSTGTILEAMDKKKLTAFILAQGPEKFNMPCEH